MTNWRGSRCWSTQHLSAEPITFTFHELLARTWCWSINGRYYTKAEEGLSRLQATAMGFTSDPRWAPGIGVAAALASGVPGPWQRKRPVARSLIDRKIVVRCLAGDRYTKFA